MFSPSCPSPSVLAPLGSTGDEEVSEGETVAGSPPQCEKLEPATRNGHNGAHQTDRPQHLPSGQGNVCPDEIVSLHQGERRTSWLSAQCQHVDQPPSSAAPLEAVFCLPERSVSNQMVEPGRPVVDQPHFGQFQHQVRSRQLAGSQLHVPHISGQISSACASMTRPGLWRRPSEESSVYEQRPPPSFVSGNMGAAASEPQLVRSHTPCVETQPIQGRNSGMPRDGQGASANWQAYETQGNLPHPTVKDAARLTMFPAWEQRHSQIVSDSQFFQPLHGRDANSGFPSSQFVSDAKCSQTLYGGGVVNSEVPSQVVAPTAPFMHPHGQQVFAPSAPFHHLQRHAESSQLHAVPGQFTSSQLARSNGYLPGDIHHPQGQVESSQPCAVQDKFGSSQVTGIRSSGYSLGEAYHAQGQVESSQSHAGRDNFGSSQVEDMRGSVYPRGRALHASGQAELSQLCAVQDKFGNSQVAGMRSNGYLLGESYHAQGQVESAQLCAAQDTFMNSQPTDTRGNAYPIGRAHHPQAQVETSQLRAAQHPFVSSQMTDMRSTASANGGARYPHGQIESSQICAEHNHGMTSQLTDLRSNGYSVGGFHHPQARADSSQLHAVPNLGMNSQIADMRSNVYSMAAAGGSKKKSQKRKGGLRPGMRILERANLSIPRSMWPFQGDLPQVSFVPVDDFGVRYMLCAFCRCDKVYQESEVLLQHMASVDCPQGRETLFRLRAEAEQRLGIALTMTGGHGDASMPSVGNAVNASAAGTRIPDCGAGVLVAQDPPSTNSAAAHSTAMLVQEAIVAAAPSASAETSSTAPPPAVAASAPGPDSPGTPAPADRWKRAANSLQEALGGLGVPQLAAEKAKGRPYAARLQLLKELRDLDPDRYRQFSQSIAGLEGRSLAELGRLVEDARQAPSCAAALAVRDGEARDRTDFASVQRAFQARLMQASSAAAWPGGKAETRAAAAGGGAGARLSVAARLPISVPPRLRSEFLERDLLWEEEQQEEVEDDQPLGTLWSTWKEAPVRKSRRLAVVSSEQDGSCAERPSQFAHRAEDFARLIQDRRLESVGRC